MKYMVCEIIKHYHEVDIDEELDIEDVVKTAELNLCLSDNGAEAIADILQKYKDKYGFDYMIKADHYGKESVELSVIEEID